MFKFISLKEFNEQLNQQKVTSMRREQRCSVNIQVFDYLIHHKDIDTFIDNLTWQKMTLQDVMKHYKAGSQILWDKGQGFLFVHIKNATFINVVAFRVLKEGGLNHVYC